MATEGIVYYADAPRYFAQAERSVASLRRVMPDVHVTLTTTATDVSVEGFDAIRTLEVAPDDPTRIGKIRAIATAPYSKLIYVDTDTIFAGDVSSIFEALDDFGVTASLAPIRRSPAGAWDQTLPECFTGLNGGVLGVNLTDPATAAFMAAWEAEYRDTIDTTRQDQPSFNRLLYRSLVRFLVLPDEFNFRAEFSNQAKGAGMGVKVIHSHAVNEMPPARTDDLIRKLSDERFATFMREDDDIAVQYSKLPTLTAMPQVARSLDEGKLVTAVRAAHIWRTARDRRNLQREVFEILAEEDGLSVLQIGAPINPVLELINGSKAGSAICVTNLAALRRVEVTLTTPAARIVEADIGEQDGEVEVVRPASSVPREQVIDPATGAMGVLHRFVPRLRPDHVRTRRPVYAWPRLLEETGIGDVDALALTTPGQDHLVVDGCLRSIAAGDLPAPRLIQIKGARLTPRVRRDMRKALRRAGYWVMEEGDPLGTLAVRPSVFGLSPRSG